MVRYTLYLRMTVALIIVITRCVSKLVFKTGYYLSCIIRDVSTSHVTSLRSWQSQKVYYMFRELFFLSVPLASFDKKLHLLEILNLKKNINYQKNPLKTSSLQSENYHKRDINFESTYLNFL